MLGRQLFLTRPLRRQCPSIWLPKETMQTMLFSSAILHYFIIISSLFHVQIVHAVISLPPNIEIPAVIALGDSLVDPGNNNNLATVGKSNFPPYGRNFMGGKPTGRFCNGKIPTDLIVDQLGIKKILPAYLDPSLKPTDLPTGVSFASAASGFDPLTSRLMNVISMDDQLKMYREYVEKLKKIVGVERTEKIVKDSLYLVVSGSDDIANTYFILNARREYDIPGYAEFLSGEAVKFVQELLNLGARRIAVFGTPPVGCLPSQRTLGGGLQRQCAEKSNEAAMIYNSKLISKLDRLNANYKNAKAVYINIYDPFLDILQNPMRYGFEVVNKGCCGTGNIEVAILCNKLSPSTCSNVTKYVFWDSYHPTEKAYSAIVIPLIEKYKQALICVDPQCQ